MDEELLMQNFCLISGIAADEASPSGNRWCSPAGRSSKASCARAWRWKSTSSGWRWPCAALANHRFQTIQGTVCAGVKVGDISFTQSDGAQARRELLEMVGDLIDSQGICLKGVAVCTANK